MLIGPRIIVFHNRFSSNKIIRNRIIIVIKIFYRCLFVAIDILYKLNSLIISNIQINKNTIYHNVIL